ncbi:hypothetical protein IZY60_11750 [Lutibacter sp. B2]|nr:hypothetical protein [Lutibacter sp. B2]
MRKTSQQMILMRLVYSIFKSFVLIFVNIYLWKTGKDIKVVAIFNICNYIAAFFSFYIANRIAMKNMKLNYLFSSLSFISLFVLTVILGDHISRYAMMIGILGGFGDGLFFFNLNVFQAGQLSRDDGDQFMSVMGIVTKISAIITPFISGLIIEKYGFLNMVYVLIILLLFQIGNALMLPSSKINTVAKINFNNIIDNNSFKRLLMTNTTHSPYGEFTIMVNSVFLYSFAKSESLMGVLNSSFAISSIILYYVYIKVQKKVKRKKLMFIGAISLVFSILLLYKPSFLTFILFGLTISIGDAFFNKPLVGIQLYTCRKYSKEEDEMLGNLLTRVFLLTTGRSLFYIMIYFFFIDYSSLIFKIFIIYNVCIPFINYNLCREEI